MRARARACVRVLAPTRLHQELPPKNLVKKPPPPTDTPGATSLKKEPGRLVVLCGAEGLQGQQPALAPGLGGVGGGLGAQLLWQAALRRVPRRGVLRVPQVGEGGPLLAGGLLGGSGCSAV